MMARIPINNNTKLLNSMDLSSMLLSCPFITSYELIISMLKSKRHTFTIALEKQFKWEGTPIPMHVLLEVSLVPS